MTMWDEDALGRFGDSEEVELASRRSDGSLRPYVTIWIVRVDDELFVRSAYGPDNGWFRRALNSELGSLRAGTLERDVAFLRHDASNQRAIDDAYRAKYASFPDIVEGIVGPALREVTLRLDPVPL